MKLDQNKDMSAHVSTCTSCVEVVAVCVSMFHHKNE